MICPGAVNGSDFQTYSNRPTILPVYYFLLSPVDLQYYIEHRKDKKQTRKQITKTRNKKKNQEKKKHSPHSGSP
jgi:hypothetical protein